jgi:DNA invertase Pin-like site-specific DNA recombinase
MGKKPLCTKAVAYIRASTGLQEITPQDQREKIEAYCKLAGLDLVEVVTERGVSGKVKLSKRPEGSRVLTMLANGVCHVVALKLDRLFRNAGDALATVDAWQDAGIHLHLVDLGGVSASTSSSIGKLLLTMLAGFAEFERNVISERTCSALRYQKAHGKVYARALYGYDAVDGALVPNQAEQRVLERMRTMRAERTSYSGIANELNDAGIPAKQGGAWHPFSVQKVLQTASPSSR